MNPLPRAFDVPRFSPDIPGTQTRVLNLMARHDVDILHIPSGGRFLDEYTPLADSLRHALTGFTGSQGDGFILSAHQKRQMAAPFTLFVDGRYHTQAQAECEPAHVNLVLHGIDLTGEAAQDQWLTEHLRAGDRVGIILDRVSWRRYLGLQSLCEAAGAVLVPVPEDEITAAAALPGWTAVRPLEFLPDHVGVHNPARLRAALQTLDGRCYATSTADSLAWFLNARAFHLPRMAGVHGWLFALNGATIVFFPVPRTPPGWAGRPDVRWIFGDWDELRRELTRHHVTEILCNGDRAVAGLPHFLQRIWPHANLTYGCDVLERVRAEKTPAEIEVMERDFLRAARAQARALRWLKGHFSDGTQGSPTELALSRQVENELEAEGALELSFRTIAARGENSAVVHYSGASDAQVFSRGDLALLDMGAYFETGFATDCTRTILCGTEATPEQKRIYTTVLRALVAGLTARFPASTAGRDIDAVVRGVCRTQGEDYQHGTGHGIGILVHESAPGLRITETRPLIPNSTVSVEPGIYHPGQFGVRLENCVIVRAGDGRIGFENLTWIGFDWDLVEPAFLTTAESDFLTDYERRCQELGTSLTSCPFLG